MLEISTSTMSFVIYRVSIWKLWCIVGQLMKNKKLLFFWSEKFKIIWHKTKVKVAQGKTEPSLLLIFLYHTYTHRFHILT